MWNNTGLLLPKIYRKKTNLSAAVCYFQLTGYWGCKSDPVPNLPSSLPLYSLLLAVAWNPVRKDWIRTERTGSGQKGPEPAREDQIRTERVGSGQKGPDPDRKSQIRIERTGSWQKELDPDKKDRKRSDPNQHQSEKSDPEPHKMTKILVLGSLCVSMHLNVFCDLKLLIFSSDSP